MIDIKQPNNINETAYQSGASLGPKRPKATSTIMWIMYAAKAFSPISVNNDNFLPRISHHRTKAEKSASEKPAANTR